MNAMSFVSDFIHDPIPTTRMAMRMMKARVTVNRAFDLSVGPVVAYGHPKTATHSVKAAIAEIPGIRAFHAHVLNPRHFIWRRNNLVPSMPSGVCSEDNPPQWALSEGLDGNRGIRLITLVRDPVAVQVSWFFFGMQRWLRSSRPVDLEAIGADELRSIFYGSFPRDGILNWFDEEWSTVTGHDMEDLTEVATKGHASVEFGPHGACVLSASLGDEAKGRILEDFLGLEVGAIKFPRKNTAAERPHQGIHQQIKSMVASDRGLLDRSYESRYARLLFSPEALEGFRSHWERQATTSG